MFYNRNTIDNLFRCPKCLDKLDIPISLPCGYCVCETCVYEFTYTQTVFNSETSSEWEIECTLCNKTHSVPENGFPIQKYLFELISNLNPSTELYDIQLNEFKALFTELNQTIANFRDSFRQSIEKLNEHSNLIKHEINNRVLLLTNSLESLKKHLLIELDKTEKQKITEISSYVSFINNQVNIKLNEWKQLLSNQSVNDNTINRIQRVQHAINDATNLIKKFDDYNNELKNLFNKAMNIQFDINEKPFAELIVGEIKVDQELSTISSIPLPIANIYDQINNASQSFLGLQQQQEEIL